MGLLRKLFPPPSRDKFARIMLRALRKAGVTREVTYDAEAFCFRFGGGGGTSFLHNAYNDYLRASRRQRREVIGHYCRVMGDRKPKAPTLEQARDKLLPRVRERFYHESIKLVAQLEDWKDADFPHKPVSDDLTVELVIDQPESVQVLGAKVLRDWNVTFDELLPAARDNLWKISNEDFTQIVPALYVSPWRDTHDASRLFLHDLVWQLKVKGPHVAMVPERNVLLVTGADDVENVVRMVQLAEQVYAEQHRRMTLVPAILDGTRWRAWQPPQDHPAHGVVKRAIMRSMATCYAEQTDLLNKLYAKTKQDIFVAKHSVVQRKDGTWFSWAVWVKEVTHALLPEAEQVLFGSTRDGEKAELGYAAWPDVRRVLSHLMEPTDLYPPRYRLRSFPDESLLAQLNLKKFGGGEDDSTES